MGIHISEEASGQKTCKEVWEATFATLFGKLFFTSSFIVPFLLFDTAPAVIISVLWGLLLIILISLLMAKEQKIKPFKVIQGHVAIVIFVMILTHFVGDVISLIFK
jgi:VIT1/CCC1 family predicted Fe2+/Mn2+ transporter